jgi:uncharacterized membrane protein
MAYCPNCGTAVEGRFCANCGTAIDQGSTQAPPSSAGAHTGGMTENMAGALCYLAGFITGILFLVLEPYNRNRKVRFHAFQSIFLTVGLMAFWIILTVISAIMPWFIAALIWVIWIGLLLGGIGLWLFMMFKTYNNEKVVLPIVGPMAEKQA